MRARILSEARKLLGVQYRDHGRTPHGVDCAGLILLAKNFAMNSWDDFLDYEPNPTPSQIHRAVKRFASRTSSPRPADVLLTRHFGAVTHLGLFTGSTLIHADRFIGHVVEAPISGVDVVAAYSLHGVD